MSQDLPHIEAIARAINPLVWSDDASEAHRAATPHSVDAARLMSMKDAFGLAQRLEVGGYRVVRIKVGVSRPIDITEN